MIGHEEVDDIIDEERITIGNHTRSHLDLSSTTDKDRLSDEILGARELFEDEFGIDVNHFCYPYGRHNDEAVEIVRGSHDSAVGTLPRLIDTDVDRYRLPRVHAHNSSSVVRWELSDMSFRLRSS